MHILIVDDDPSLQKLISFMLAQAGYSSSQASDRDSAMRLLYTSNPNLVLLDIAMPDTNGFEICREIRSTSDVPIIFLSAFSQVEERVTGLQLGGDDYIVKPFHTDELIARIEAVIRRCADNQADGHTLLKSGGLSLNLVMQTITLSNRRTIGLSPVEFNLLHYLMRHPGQALTPDQILFNVWGTTHNQRNNLAVFIRRLRRKLEADTDSPRYITTVTGLGYRFEAA